MWRRDFKKNINEMATMIPSIPLSSGNAITQNDRHTILLARAKQMSWTEGYIGTLVGEPSIGKSYCAKILSELLLQNEIHANHMLVYEGIEADDGLAIIDWLERSISKDIKPKGGDRIRGFFRRGPIKGLYKIAVGFGQDLAKRYELQKTADAVSDLIGSELLHTDVKVSDGSRLGERIASLRKNVAQTNFCYFLIVDGVEKIAAPGLRVLADLAKTPIRNIRIMLFVDGRWNEGREISEMRTLKAILQNHHAKDIGSLLGLSPVEIKLWYERDRKEILASADANTAYINSSAGMPGILKSWIKSGSRNPEDVLLHGVTAWGSIKIVTDQLSDLARNVLNITACAYPSKLKAVHLLVLCKEFTEAQIIKAIRELRANDLVIDADGIKCKTRNLSNFIKSEIGETMVNYLSGLVLDAALGPNNSHRVLPEPDMHKLAESLISANQNDPGAINFILRSAENALHSGAFRLAERILLSVGSLPDNQASNWERPNRTQYARLHADLSGQYGNYRAAIDWAERGLATAEGQEVTQLQLSMGDKYLQLGRYKEASLQFKAARRIARESVDINRYAEAIIKTVKIAFDLGRYASCRQIIHKFAEQLPELKISEKIRCSSHRWIARVYSTDRALYDQALEHANNALTIAIALDSERDIGNCHFVFGEIFRRISDHHNAFLSYQKALSAAKNSGNKDLETYSLFGSILVLGAERSWEKYKHVLSEIELCLDYEAPIESIYVAVLKIILEIREDSRDGGAIFTESIQSLNQHRKTGLMRLLESTDKSAVGTCRNEIEAFQWESFIL